MTEAERILEKLLQTTSKEGLINLCKSRHNKLKAAQEQLTKERKLRKELVECIEDLKVLESSMDVRKEIESLLQKDREL